MANERRIPSFFFSLLIHAYPIGCPTVILNHILSYAITFYHLGRRLCSLLEMKMMAILLLLFEDESKRKVAAVVR